MDVEFTNIESMSDPKKTKHVTFGHLHSGDVFIISKDYPLIYMKLDNEYRWKHENLTINAVNLVKGIGIRFDDNQEVGFVQSCYQVEPKDIITIVDKDWTRLEPWGGII